jgi:hypothetical protein
MYERCFDRDRVRAVLAERAIRSTSFRSQGRSSPPLGGVATLPSYLPSCHAAFVGLVLLPRHPVVVAPASPQSCLSHCAGAWRTQIAGDEVDLGRRENWGDEGERPRAP